MKGDPKVLELLNEALKNELTATNQYWLHYRLLDNWGVDKLAQFEAVRQHSTADDLADRGAEVAVVQYLLQVVEDLDSSAPRKDTSRPGPGTDAGSTSSGIRRARTGASRCPTGSRRWRGRPP